MISSVSERTEQMKKNEVKVGKVYAVKVSGKIVPVRIDKETTRTGRRIGTEYNNGRAYSQYAEATGWIGVNIITARIINIRSAAKLRYEVEKTATGWAKVLDPAVKAMAEAARDIAERTKDLSVVMRYAKWPAVAFALLKAGYSATQTEEIMRGEWPLQAATDLNIMVMNSANLLSWMTAKGHKPC
jgi:hypothetical protein